ncbi:hypothetical protein [Kribbella rubisoli]|uniref:hypothetical protein n=1 Tax=Kribbella rubisoli TaxID=3075929 RepID=UPI001F543F62|nr:hypothetical protein [Kribbella rubisoli]
MLTGWPAYGVDALDAARGGVVAAELFGLAGWWAGGSAQTGRATWTTPWVMVMVQ